MDKPARKLLAVQPMKRLAILFISIVGILPFVRGENAAEGIVAAISPAAKAKIDALVHAQPAERITPGIAVAIAKDGQTPSRIK